MKSLTCFRLLVLVLAALIAAPPVARASVTGEAVEQGAKQLRRALGKDLAEFGGERATRELAERIVREGGEGSAARLNRIARVGDPSTVRALQNVPARSLRHLDDVPDDQLVRAVGTLSRPGVGDTLTALGSDGLRSAALRAEMRLPGAGARLVREFGDDALEASAKLGDNQANQLLKAERVDVVRRLAPPQRRALLDAVASNPTAQVQVIHTTGKAAATGIAVVAGGVVLWHATDVALAPTQHVVTHPDGTIERTTTSVGGQAAAALPRVAETYVPVATSLGYAAVAAAALLGLAFLLLRHLRQLRPRRRAARGGA